MNKIILIGNLTRDPELRSVNTANGPTSVCDFTIAVNRRGMRNQQNNGQQGGDADFFRITAWRGLGDTCARYLGKGRKVYVSGPLSARTYQANDGSTRVSLEVTADEVEFLSARAAAMLRRRHPRPHLLRPWRRIAALPLWKPTSYRSDRALICLELN